MRLQTNCYVDIKFLELEANFFQRQGCAFTIIDDWERKYFFYMTEGGQGEDLFLTENFPAISF